MVTGFKEHLLNFGVNCASGAPTWKHGTEQLSPTFFAAERASLTFA